jgi:hypothetical protein
MNLAYVLLDDIVPDTDVEGNEYKTKLLRASGVALVK